MHIYSIDLQACSNEELQVTKSGFSRGPHSLQNAPSWASVSVPATLYGVVNKLLETYTKFTLFIIIATCILIINY